MFSSSCGEQSCYNKNTLAGVANDQDDFFDALANSQEEKKKMKLLNHTICRSLHSTMVANLKLHYL